MRRALSMTSLAALDILVPTLASVLFCFIVIYLFGPWFALTGAVIGVLLTLAVLMRIAAAVEKTAG